MRNINYVLEGKKDFLYLSKYFILSILVFLFTVIWIPFVILTNFSFQTYGWGVDTVVDTLPKEDQIYRLWMLFFSSLILFCSVYNFYCSIKIKKLTDLSRYIFGFGFFSWLFFVDLIKKNDRISFLFLSWKYYTQNIELDEQVNIGYLFWCFSERKMDKLSRNTLLYLFTFLFLFVGFIFILIPEENYYLNTTFSFNTIIYFTNITNLGCFLFIILFIFIQKRKMNDNNTYAIFMNSYITVVMLTYWLALFPMNMANGTFQQKSTFEIIKAIWLHGVTPIFFIWFTMNSIAINKQAPNRSIIRPSLSLMVYPLWYMSFAYSIPFFLRESVYGIITNINPYGYIYNGTDFSKNGSFYFLFGVLGFGLLFWIFFIFYRFINIKIVKNRNWHQTRTLLI